MCLVSVGDDERIWPVFGGPCFVALTDLFMVFHLFKLNDMRMMVQKANAPG